MYRARVICDLDGVVGQFVAAFLRAYLDAGGVMSVGFKVTDWNFPDRLPDQRAVAKAWRNPAIFRDQLLYPRADEGLEILNKNFDLVIATSAAFPLGVHIPAKVKWLAEVAPFISQNQVVFTSRKELLDGAIFIEDYHMNIARWIKEHPKGEAYMIRRPWNKDYRAMVEDVGATVFKGELYGLAVKLTGGPNGKPSR